MDDTPCVLNCAICRLLTLSLAEIGELYRAAPAVPHGPHQHVLTGRSCVVCERTFLAETARYCSQRCAQMAYRDRQRHAGHGAP